jgi:hypothetical protein
MKSGGGKETCFSFRSSAKAIAGDEQPPIALTVEEREGLATSKAAAARGEFATNEQGRAVWAKYGL